MEIRMVILAAATVGSAYVWWRMWFPAPSRVRNDGESFAKEHLAMVDGEFVAAFDRAWLISQRISACVLLAIIPLWFAFMLLADDVTSGFGFIPVLAVGVALRSGVGLRAAGREFPVPPGRSQVARPRRVVVDDYIQPRQRFAVYAVAAFACIVLGAAIVGLRSGSGQSRPYVFAAVGSIATVVLVVFVVLYARALCGRPQAAVDGCHLYLQDAWRSTSLRDAYGAVMASGFVLALGLPAGQGDGWLADYDDFVALVVGCLFFYSLYDDSLRFRKRLWPTLEPGQVLGPGEPVPTRVVVRA